jgi:anti-anti-sigma factor
MTLSFQDTPEGTLITLQGRLDAMTSPVAQAEIERHLGAHPGPVTFDCSGLSYISSAGLRVLLFAAKKSKTGLTLKGLNAGIRETIDIAGFSMIFKIV